MKIEEALEGISISNYMHRCGTKHMTIKKTKKGDFKFNKLPPNMQDGLISLLCDLRTIEKMCYSYSIDVVNYHLKAKGVKLNHFYKMCGFKYYFPYNPKWSSHGNALPQNEHEGRMIIRRNIMRLNNRIFKYILQE